MSQSKNKTNWITGLLVPLLVVCLAVGWLLWMWWASTNPVNEVVPQESFANVIPTIPEFNMNRLTGSSDLIKNATNFAWRENTPAYTYNFKYYNVIVSVFDKQTLINSLVIRRDDKTTDFSIYKDGNYGKLSPLIIEKLISIGKAKLKPITSLIGYVNIDENKEGFYLLTDNGSDEDFYIPGDIYIPMTYVNKIRLMVPLGFENYIVFHKDIIDTINVPVFKQNWTDKDAKGNLNNGIVYFNNNTLVGYVYNDNIFKTVNKYYFEFGFIDSMGNFVTFPESEKPSITSASAGAEAIVTYKNATYNYKYFDVNNYMKHKRPNNISINKINKIIAELLPKNDDAIDELSAYTGFVQKANVISTDPGVSSPANQTIDEAVTYSFVRKIQLGDTYYVKQMCIANLFTDATVSDIRIGIKNNRNNTIQFVGFSERLLGADGTNYLAAITKRSGPYLVIQDVKTAYGNELSGDEVIIYSKIETNQTTATPINVCITGYPENEKLDYKTLYTDAKPIAGLPPTKKSDGTYPQSLYTDGEVSQTTQTDVPSHITTVTLAAYTGGTAPYDKLAYKSDVTTLNAPKNGDKLTVLFKNNYSNNSFQVPGPVNQTFIFHTQAPNLFFYKTVIANKFKIYFDKVGNDANTWHAAAVSARGYTPTSADINRFKLEFNVTDIRGSINPEAVCPSMDKFLANQLDSEVILDAMDYNDRINTEQAKLIGQKDNLLTLMEQEEDIARLNRVINRLLDVEKQRAAETNTLNAVKFTNQMKEAMKLKEVLEQRIAQRKKNTLDLQFRVNQVVETDQLPTPTLATSKEPFEDIPVPTNATNRVRPAMEDDLRIR